jgi:3-oxoacyl-[acyl-carrier protein] reductase
VNVGYDEHFRLKSPNEDVGLYFNFVKVFPKANYFRYSLTTVRTLDLGVKGLRVLVTASTRGIGRGVAEVLLEGGAKVVINGSREESVAEAVKSLKSTYGSDAVNGFKADLRSGEEISSLVKNAVEFLGGLDGLAYVTGPPRAGYFGELSRDDWEEGVKLLIMSAVDVVKESLPYLLKSPSPSIVFLTSVAVKEPIPNIVLSNTLRIAVHGLMKSLARELGPKGVRVNAVMPGYVLTDRVKYLAKVKAEKTSKSVNEVIKEMVCEVPLGRIAEPKEIGYVVAFLLGRYSSYVNGASVPVDGGLLKSQF